MGSATASDASKRQRLYSRFFGHLHLVSARRQTKNGLSDSCVCDRLPFCGSCSSISHSCPCATQRQSSIRLALLAFYGMFSLLRMTSINDFDYQLPQDRIAQHPAEPRDSSRLLILDRNTGEMEHKFFRDIVDELHSGDLLIMNNSKVFKARLQAKVRKMTLEVFLLRPDGSRWESLIKRSRRLKPGDELDFGTLKARVVEKQDDGIVLIDFDVPPAYVFQLAEEKGEVPLPPYIESTVDNSVKYQTVYAERTGSVAAPTAGFHFTPELMDRIREKGVEITFVTLHVGLGTFRPILSETLEEHEMHAEWYEIPEETVEKMKRAKRRIAVGTTTTRALESAFADSPPFQGGVRGGSEKVKLSGETNLFISPGYTFKAVDAMITNFHLPKSSLLVMISAFAGREHVLEAYREAIERNYRFYSFGDAMFIR